MRTTILTTKYVWFIVHISALFLVLLAGCGNRIKFDRDCTKPVMGTRCVTRPSGTIHCRYVDLCYEYDDLLLPGENPPPEKLKRQ